MALVASWVNAAKTHALEVSKNYSSRAHPAHARGEEEVWQRREVLEHLHAPGRSARYAPRAAARSRTRKHRVRAHLEQAPVVQVLQPRPALDAPHGAGDVTELVVRFVLAYKPVSLSTVSTRCSSSEPAREQPSWAALAQGFCLGVVSRDLPSPRWSRSPLWALPSTVAVLCLQEVYLGLSGLRAELHIQPPLTAPGQFPAAHERGP